MRQEYCYYVYIISNHQRDIFYIGVTNDLLRRANEHRLGLIPGYSRDNGLKYLVYFEETDDIAVALTREKQLKNWHRNWKLDLIRKINPNLGDLSAGWYDTDAETSSA
jgi:putative endonuclease